MQPRAIEHVQTGLRHDLLYRPGWLYARYVRDVMTLTEIATMTGMSRTSVTLALERYGIERRKPARRFVRRELCDADWLRSHYEQERQTTVQIAARLGVCVRTVNQALRRHGIPVRLPRHHTRPRTGGSPDAGTGAPKAAAERP